MSKFGWSYPPGCTGTPYDADYPCLLCGRDETDCICPICGVCGEQGDLACYDVEGHGLEENWLQSQYRKVHELFIHNWTDQSRYDDSEALLDDFATIEMPSFRYNQP